MKEQIKDCKLELITLVDELRNTTGATEVRINLQSSPYANETRINLEFNDFQEKNPPKSCYQKQ